MKRIIPPLIASLVLICSSHAQDPTATPVPTAVAGTNEVDNTKQNASEPNKNTDTAERQSNSKDDLTLAQKIRQAVMAEGALSMNAKNVKIIAREGKVTLKGPVDSQQEKDTIGAKSEAIAGKDKVDNQIEVKAEKK